MELWWSMMVLKWMLDELELLPLRSGSKRGGRMADLLLLRGETIRDIWELLAEVPEEKRPHKQKRFEVLLERSRRLDEKITRA